MSAWSDLLQSWANVIVPTLLHFLWQGALVGGIAAVMGMTLRRSTPSVRYVSYLGLFAVMAIAPLITATFLFSGVPLAPPVSLSSPQATPPASSHWPSQWHTEEAVDTIAAWQPVVLIAWLIGVGLCSLRLTGGLIWCGWLTRRLEPIPQELAIVVRRLSQRLGLKTSVRVMLSHDVHEPLAMRIIQPLIVLPTSWLLSAPTLVVEAVLAHELAHIRRHDLWVNLLQRLVESLLFFHPAVWWLSRLIRRERELCCDRLAVAVTGRAVEYAQALEAVARFRLAWSSPAMAAGMGGDRMALLDRVRRVLGLETAPETGWWPMGLAGLLLAAACGTSVFLSSSVVEGDDDKPAEKAVEKDEAREKKGDDERPTPPRREEEDRPRPPREGERRDAPRGEIRDGDRPRPPRAENRPDGPPREGDRRPEERPHEGDRAPRGFNPFGEPRGPQPEGDVMRELLMTIRELRQEVQMLREEVRASRRPGDGPRGDDFGPRGDGRREGQGRGPTPDGRRPGEEFGPRGEPGRGPAEGRGLPPGRGESREPGFRPEGLSRGERREDGPRPEGAPRADRREDGPRPEGRVDDAKPRRPEGDRKPEEVPKTSF